MSKLTVRFFWVLALLATGVVGGCGREQTPAVPPVVLSTVPALGATAVAFNALISATFNETMNPATITTGTFTLTAPGGILVPGTVTSSGLTVTFEGSLDGSGPNVRWSSVNRHPGTYTISLRLENGRNGTANCSVSVSVAPAAESPAIDQLLGGQHTVTVGDPVRSLRSRAIRIMTR
jgi:hypothetical protein